MTGSRLVRLRRTVLRGARRAARGRERVGLSLEPVSRAYGYDRGTPVDRRYIDAFVAAHGADVRGHVLDIGDDANARRFGRDLARVDVLNPVEGIPGTTIVGDLETGAGIPGECFDCVLLLETLNVIYDVRRAVQAVHAALKPRGVVLATANGLAPKETQWADYWRLTEASMRRLFGDVFGAGQVHVRTYGNVVSATAYLYGLAAEELSDEELAHHDPSFEVSVCARAVRR